MGHSAATRVLFIAKYWIGWPTNAVNIAELVIFHVEGNKRLSKDPQE